MNRETGQTLSGFDSLRQRLTDCLSFPKGSLVGRRNYGADLLALLDRNVTASFTMDAFMLISEAVNEPENGLTDFQLDQIGMTSIGDGWIELVLVGTWVPSGEDVTLEGVRVGGN